MFAVLVFRAWIEMKNFKLMWRELEWRRLREHACRILEEEKELFGGSEEGKELYELLCKLFECKIKA